MKYIYHIAMYIIIINSMISPGIAQEEPSSRENIPSISTEEKHKKAKKLFIEADAYYKIREYQKALTLYKEVYLLSLKPALLFNIGQCYRFLGKYEEAIVSYETFLHDEPNTEFREEIEGFIAEMSVMLATKQTSTLPASIPDELPKNDPIPDSKTPPSTLPSPILVPISSSKPPPTLSKALYGGAIGTGSLGLIAGGVAITFAIESKRLEKNQVESESIQKAFNRAKTFSIGSNILLGTALLSFGTGYLLKRNNRAKEKTSLIKLNILPSSAVMTVRF